MNARVERPVFTARGRRWTWLDVLRHAQRRGELEPMATRIRRATARLVSAPPTAAEVRAASVRFRREHRLLAAEDLEAWLSRWALTTEEWQAFVRRSLVIPPRGTRASALLDVEDLLWPEAVCSGALFAWAREAAVNAAAAGPAALARLRKGAASAETVRREMTARQLDWTSVDAEVAIFATEDAAREAVLCVVADGMSLTDAGGFAGVTPARRRAFVEDFPAPMRGALRSAAVAALTGPIEMKPGHGLVVVRHRRPPTVAYRRVQERARAALADRAISRVVNQRVVWHEQF